jgi:hypothetical protein
MHHGVDAGRGRDVCGQTERQFRIEDRPVRQQSRRNDTLLLGRRCGDDCDRRHLRAGAGRGRRQQQRKPLALGKADAVDIVEAVRRLGEIGHKLRGVERAAASDRGDQFDLLVAAERDRSLDDMRRRIRLHVLKYREFTAARNKARLGIFCQPRVANALVGDQKDALCAISRNQLSQFLRCAHLE